MLDFNVRLAPNEAAMMVMDYLSDKGASNECVDVHSSLSDDGKQVFVLVFEKYYMRNSSRASLAVTIEDLSGVTHVHGVGSGGGQGLIFKFDWGASESFEELVYTALENFVVN